MTLFHRAEYVYQLIIYADIGKQSELLQRVEQCIPLHVSKHMYLSILVSSAEG